MNLIGIKMAYQRRKSQINLKITVEVNLLAEQLILQYAYVSMTFL